MKRIYILLALLVLVSLAAVFKSSLRRMASYAGIEMRNGKTVEQRLEQYGAAARARLKPYFAQAQVAYPPKSAVLIGLKAEHELQVYALDEKGTQRFVRSYSILAASGVPGPKLREGDQQVPEGIYPIELLNPNSLYHLSLRIGYPNAADREHAKKESRSNLGGDIMIHGGALSVGCLAIGDEAAEDLLVLAADCGITNIAVILTPVDFRAGKQVPSVATLPEWSGEVYEQIKSRLAELPLPTEK
jgi:murein L,D-transpeptidase YafK